MPIRHDDPFEESEVLSSRREHPSEIHNHTHYNTQSKNGNGHGNSLNTSLLGFCGALLLILVAITGFMWKSQIDFQREAAERTARLEAQMVIVLNRLPP